MTEVRSLFQIQHIADFAVQPGGGPCHTILDVDLRRASDFIVDPKAVNHLPPALKTRTREFYPFLIRLDDKTYEIWCETTDAVLPKLMTEILNKKMLDFVRKTENEIERILINKDYEKGVDLLEGWYQYLRALRHELSAKDS